MSSSQVSHSKHKLRGFYYIEEDPLKEASMTGILSELLVSKLKSWFPFNDNEKQQVRALYSVGLFDQKREGISLYFSPDKSLVVVVQDFFGRISVINTTDGTVVASLEDEGFIRCTVSFINSIQDRDSIDSSKPDCLVILSPSKESVQVWSIERKEMVVSLPASKTTSIIPSSMGPDVLRKDCFLFDCTSGSIFLVDVPFVCTLSPSDTHFLVLDGLLLKEFKAALIRGDHRTQLICLEKMKSLKSQTLNLALESGHEEAEFIAKSVIDMMLVNGEQGLEILDKLFLQSCLRVLQLVSVFKFLSVKQDVNLPIRQDCHVNPPEDIEELSLDMGWTAVDVAKILSLFSLRNSVMQVRGAPLLRTLIPFQDFVSFFVIEETRLIKSGDNEEKLATDSIPIEMKQDPCQELLSRFMFEMLLEDANQDMFKCLESSFIVPEALLSLLIQFWLSLDSCFCQDWLNWKKLSLAVRRIAMRMTETTYEDDSFPLSWQVVCSHIISCNNMSAALSASFVVKNALQYLFNESKKNPSLENREQSDSQDNSFPENEDEDWETLHVDRERLNIVSKQLEDLFLLDLLLNCNFSQEKGFAIKSRSLVDLLNSHYGFVSEVVSRWAVFLELDINLFFKDDEEEAKEAIETPDQEEEPIDAVKETEMRNSPSNDNIKELLAHVRQCFPHSLNRQVMFVNSSVECISRWIKNPSPEDGILNRAVFLLKSMTNQAMRHNLATIVWQSFLNDPLKLISYMTDNLGRLPKDDVLRNEVGLPEECLDPLLHFSHSILEILLENTFEGEPIVLPKFKNDDWWGPKKAKRDPNFVSVVSDAKIKPVNSSLIIQHLHLIQSLIFMSQFRIKGVRPLSLLDSVSKQFLFGDLALDFNPGNRMKDGMVLEKRVEFLEKVVMSIADCIPSETLSLEQDLYLSPSRIHSEANKFFGEALNLARSYNVDTDYLRRKYVVKVYANGSDSLGEELRTSCRDTNTLALDLLPIICHRILISNDENGQVFLSLPPPVLKWIKSMTKACPVKVSPASSASTRLLMQFVRLYLNDQNNLDLLSALIDHF